MKKEKIGVVFFHKNIYDIYEKYWIKKSIESIYNQTEKNLHIYEINYGTNGSSILDDYDFNKKFYHKEKINYADAMNFIITKAFDDGCDYVFNTNLDDYYKLNRVEEELKFLREGYDVVSSDFCYIKDVNGVDVVINHMRIKEYGDIKMNLLKNHNVIAHPCVAFSKNFWTNNRYDISKIPEEDLDLWKSSIMKGYTFYIHPEELLYYRIHENQVSPKK